MENGRCRHHGGRTPKGDAWHKPRLPKRGEKGGVERFDKKLMKIEKRTSSLRKRLAAMTPEKREEHLAWQASHRPGPAAIRAQRRQNIADQRWLDLVRGVSREPPATSPVDFTKYREGVFG